MLAECNAQNVVRQKQNMHRAKKSVKQGRGVGGGSDNLHVCPTVCPPHCTLAYSCAK